MKKIDITDDLLYKYMPVVDEAIVNKVEENVDEEYTFSPDFKKKMEKTIRYEKSRHFWKKLSKSGRKVAIFALVILGFTLTATVSVQAYRLKFFETIKRVFDDSYRYTYKETTTNNDEGLVECKLGYIPEGYELETESGIAIVHTWIYENAENSQIVIDQHLVTDSLDISFDSEYDSEEVFEIDENTLKIYWYKDGTSYAYYEYGNCVIVMVIDDLSSDEIVKIAENIHY